MVSKLEVIGSRITNRMLGRNKDYGGILTEVTGAQGSSKTGALLSFSTHTMRLHPKEKIFWREQYDAPLQIFKLGNGNFHFLVQKESKVVFRDRDNRLKHIKLPNVSYFESIPVYKEGLDKDGKKILDHTKPDFDDLWKKAIPGKVNVVFFGNPNEWMDFIHRLRNVGEWTNVFIDEMADICPAVNSDSLYKRIRDFAGDLGAVRRCMINVMYNTQTAQDVDWKIRKKVMLKIFLPGAITDTASRVTQRAIDNLKRDSIHGNEAYLDMGGEFGKIQFTNIFRPNPKYHIEAHVDV